MIVAKFLTEEELAGDVPAEPPKVAGPVTSEEFLSEDELMADVPRQASQGTLRQIAAFVTDPEELKTYGKTVGRLGLATADLVLGLPGQAARVGVDIFERGKGIVTGKTRAETERAVEESKAAVPEGWSAPLQYLAKMGGVEPYDQTLVSELMEKGASAVEKYTGGAITKSGAGSLFEAGMLGGMANLPKAAVKQAMAPKADFGTGARGTYAETLPEAPQGFEPRGVADRGRTPVPPTPEEAIARSQKNIKAARKAFADKEAVAQMEELANARQVKIGEALMGEETVQVTGEPRRGADGKLYTPVVRNGTQMEVPSAELAVKPQLGLENRAPKPFEPTRTLGEGGRLIEGKVLGETTSPLASGIEKIRAGQEFNLAADELLAVRGLEKASGNIVGLDGKPIQRQAGQIDQRLLAALGIGSAATFIALNPEEIEKLGTLGLIGATTMLGKDRALSVLKEKAAPYQFPTLDFLAKQHGGKTEFNAQQVLDAAKKASTEEQALVQRVVGDKKTITSDELVGGMLEETANWKLTPEGTEAYADYGLPNIGRQDKISGLDWVPEGETRAPVDVPPTPAVTTKYRLPEHMQVSDANHFSDDRLFGWTRAFKEDGVRHVVEVQSDLAQKLSGVEYSPEKFQELIGRRAEISRRMGEVEARANDPALTQPERIDARVAAREARLQLAEVDEAIQAQASSSQLSPILKNWPRRLIREELAQAAKEGEGTVRFASADTVAKVEGWPERGGEPRPDLEMDVEAFEAAQESLTRFSPGHQRIYNRYAGEITRYLKGLGGKEVTDAQGHTWIEVPTSAVQTPAGPRVKMLGQADPRLLAGVGAVTAGAALGALTDPQHSLRNAIYGAVGGGLLGTGAGRNALKTAIKSPDAALGLISTRLGNIAPELKFNLRAHELRVLKGVDAANDAALPFIQALKKLPAEKAAEVERALLNGDIAKVKAVPELAKVYPEVNRILTDLQGKLQGLGRFAEGVGNYFPRIVRDFEGLKNALGQEAAKGLEKALLNAEAKMIKKEGRSLTDIEQSIVANRYLFAQDQGSFQPGYAKARRIQEVTPELQPFYERPAESLLRYLSGAINDVEAAKFFGRDLTTRKAGKGVFTDVDSSIGNLTARLLREGKITQAQAMELRDILKARFEGGEKAMNPILANVRNLTNVGLLGNVSSAATQLGDSFTTVYHHGLVPTLQAVTQRVIGEQRITPKQLGLINHIAEELSEMGVTGRLLHTTMKYSGFHAIDMFAKGLALNAALIKNSKLVQTPKGEAAFRAKYEPAFGPETGKVIEDLKAGRRSDATDQLAFSELSDAQPVSKAEMPEMYLAHPNGRFLYQLKTYMLKQADVVRRDAYQEIAKGTPEGIKKGTKALAALATVYALSNVPGDVIKDWMAGRPVDVLSTPKLVENVLQTFGINRYAGQQLGQGKVVETVAGMVTPPLRMFQDIAKGDPKAVGYIPFVGRPIEARFFGGNARREIYETGLHNKGVPRSERKKLSPEAKAYLRQKRLKKLEENK